MILVLGWVRARVWWQECLVLMNTLGVAGGAIPFSFVGGFAGCFLFGEGRGLIWLLEVLRGASFGLCLDSSVPQPPRER